MTNSPEVIEIGQIFDCFVASLLERRASAGNPPGTPLQCRRGPADLKTWRIKDMADTVVPHFHNDVGVPVIEIGAREFMCVGAMPPFDHPHVYCDMGDDAEYVCPYCSTLYRHDPTLAPSAARPAECALHEVA
jgi:uncharacterized Zn-finger protein